MKDSFEMNEVIIDFFSGRVFSVINNYLKFTFTLKQVEARVNICFALLLGWTFQEKTNKWYIWKWKLTLCFPITSPNANVFVIECILRNGTEVEKRENLKCYS
jgi:hypothetical protein